MNPFTIVCGVAAGLVLGLFTVLVGRDQLPTPLWRVAAGALIGGCGGALFGSVGGDLNRRGKPEGVGRYVVAALAGAVAGAAAAWQYYLGRKQNQSRDREGAVGAAPSRSRL